MAKKLIDMKKILLFPGSKGELEEITGKQYRFVKTKYSQGYTGETETETHIKRILFKSLFVGVQGKDSREASNRFSDEIDLLREHHHLKIDAFVYYQVGQGDGIVYTMGVPVAEKRKKA
ncbi:MAG: hypothetical protein IB618_02945 [Candidatus Pacearchaeota archaeon]|nr:MAG: hypothetical protein IB618_02945 [Candidatus Pacearchaeota archaeon]